MKYAVAVMMGVIAMISAWAQQQIVPPPQQRDLPLAEETSFYFFEATNLAADESGKSRVDVAYRIDLQFFVAVRNTNPELPFPFVRRGEILVELLDRNDISIARDIHRFEIGEANPERTPDMKSWREGSTSFTVTPGEYRIVFEVVDLESSRKYLDRKKQIEAKAFDGTTTLTSTPWFIFPLDPHQPNVVTPINFGGDMQFGKGAALFVQLQSPGLTPDPVRVEYSIVTQRFSLQEPRTAATDTLAELHVLNAPIPRRLTDTPTSYSLTTPSAEPAIRAVIIPLKAEVLPLRPFTLTMTITQGNIKFPIQQRFRMVWPDMPLSLRDVDFALEALRHITRPEELDSLKSGLQNKRLTHLEEFWKRKDRTPETEYNEVMVEYYRRVDYTMRAFSSIRGDDGYKSDRGRIYILYGPPTRTERTLDPEAGYQETWTYERLSKRFVFVDRSKTGNYVLAATQNL